MEWACCFAVGAMVVKGVLWRRGTGRSIADPAGLAWVSASRSELKSEEPAPAGCLDALPLQQQRDE